MNILHFINSIFPIFDKKNEIELRNRKMLFDQKEKPFNFVYGIIKDNEFRYKKYSLLTLEKDLKKDKIKGYFYFECFIAKVNNKIYIFV